MKTQPEMEKHLCVSKKALWLYNQNKAACRVGRPVRADSCCDYIMPAEVPLPAGLLEANSCMVSRMYLCGLTGVS